jgi:DNA helicase HerA-like ATPase
MTKTSDAKIGRVIDVRGDGMVAVLDSSEQGESPKVTIGREDVLIGQIGSYVKVVQGNVSILAMLTRMSEVEKLEGTEQATPSKEIDFTPLAQRTIWLTPIGTLNEASEFERGVSIYPTTGAEVHAVGKDDLKTMFIKFESKGYDVGVLPSNPSVSVYLDPTALFGRHFAILGQTGSGKSWTVANLVQQAIGIMPKAHIIILDLHGEYCWKDNKGEVCSAFEKCNYRHVDARELEMPYWLMTYAELCDLLIDQTDFSAHNQTAAFREILIQLKEQEGKRPELELERVSLDTPIYFDLMQLRSAIEDKNGQILGKSSKMINGPLTGKFDNFLMRLDSRLNDVRYDFLLKPKRRNSSESLAELLKDFVGLGEPKSSVTIIDLSSVPFDVRPPVAAQIGRLAFEFNYWNPRYREFPILLICEESHIYIPRSDEAQFKGSRKSMERIAKEGRKYGVGIGIVSQRPHEVSETVLAQCGTFLCLRITNPNDQNYIRSLAPEAERNLIDILAGLGRGECLALGEAVPIPTRLHFYKADPPPNSDDIDFYMNWKEGLDEVDVGEIVKRWRRQER